MFHKAASFVTFLVIFGHAYNVNAKISGLSNKGLQTNELKPVENKIAAFTAAATHPEGDKRQFRSLRGYGGHRGNFKPPADDFDGPPGK